jgi:enoyl-CoA hydratase/carnithine racemase
MGLISFADNQLQLKVEGSVAFLTLNRPEKRNALTQAMWLALPEALHQIENDPRVKVMILRSSTAEAFCAGADIDEFAAFAGDAAWRRANHAAIGATQIKLATLAKPTIAQISGVCVGGGCGLANACDFRIASADARFGITPAKLGLVYSLHDTKLLVDLVGPSAAKLVLFTGRLFPAVEAKAMGWITEVVAIEDLAATTLKLADEISQNSQHSVTHTKAIVRDILEGCAVDTPKHEQLFFDAFDQPDHKEGVLAFREKRKPNF